MVDCRNGVVDTLGPYLLCIDGFTKKMFMICNNYMLFFELNIELHLNFDK